MKTTIYWKTRHLEPKEALGVKKRIRERFNIPDYTTVNGETPCEIADEDMELFRECERRGFIQIRNK